MTRKRGTKRTRPRLTRPSPLDQNRRNATQNDPNSTPSDKNRTLTPLDKNSTRESSLSIYPSTSHVSLTASEEGQDSD